MTGMLRLGAMASFSILLAASLALARPARAADAALIAAAQKEKEVVWYTVQTIPQIVTPLVAAFEKKYGIKVSYVRANSSDVVMRVENEARAGRSLSDVFDGTAMNRLRQDNLVLSWLPDFTRQWPKELADPNGYWVATNYYVNTVGINTDLVPPAAEPHSWDDLLDPRWRGKMTMGATTSSSAGPGLVGMMLRDRGPEKGRAYLEALAKQNIAGSQVAARQILDQVIAGEYAVGLMIFNHHVVISAAKGAPIKWLPFSPSMVTTNVAAVAKDAPHPNAGKLFLDFMVSDEGQAIFRDNDYLPSNPNVSARVPELIPDGKLFRGIVFTGDEINDSMADWYKTYREIFP